MRAYSAAETCLLLLYALPGEPLREGVYRKLLRAYQALEPQNSEPERQLEIQDLMAMGCNRDTAEEILYRLEQRETLYAYLRNLWLRGIQVVTRLSGDYPHRLRTTLGDRAPLVLFCAGNTALFSQSCVSLVGSRQLRDKGRHFAARAGEAIVGQNRVYCSGGAVGADTVGFTAAMDAGGQAVLFLADSLEKAMEQELYEKSLKEGRLLLVSEFGCDQAFSSQRAMSRNRLIHAMGEKVLVAQSDYGTGGTWHGTVENLKQGWSPVFVSHEEPDHPGTRGLVDRGGIPVLARELENLSELVPSQMTLG